MSNTKSASDGVFDLDAAINEVDNEPFVFTYRGREWTLPHFNDLNIWPTVDAAERGDFAAMRAVLETAFGDEWEEFHSKPLTRGGLNSLFARYQKHAGLKPGESRASTGS